MLIYSTRQVSIQTTLRGHMNTLTRWEKQYVAYRIMEYYNVRMMSTSRLMHVEERRPKADMPAHYSGPELRGIASVIIQIGWRSRKKDLRNEIKRRLDEKEG